MKRLKEIFNWILEWNGPLSWAVVILGWLVFLLIKNIWR